MALNTTDDDELVANSLSNLKIHESMAGDEDCETVYLREDEINDFLEKYLRENPDSDVEHRYIKPEPSDYTQHIEVRWLRPETPPEAPPIIIREEASLPPIELKPLRIIEMPSRQQPESPPPVVIIREAPPILKPTLIDPKVIYVPPQKTDIKSSSFNWTDSQTESFLQKQEEQQQRRQQAESQTVRVPIEIQDKKHQELKQQQYVDMRRHELLLQQRYEEELRALKKIEEKKQQELKIQFEEYKKQEFLKIQQQQLYEERLSKQYEERKRQDSEKSQQKYVVDATYYSNLYQNEFNNNNINDNKSNQDQHANFYIVNDHRQYEEEPQRLLKQTEQQQQQHSYVLPITVVTKTMPTRSSTIAPSLTGSFSKLYETGVSSYEYYDCVSTTKSTQERASSSLLNKISSNSSLSGIGKV
jgi:hypothetical protein